FAHDVFTEYSLALVAIQEVGEQIDPINGLRILSRVARASQTAALAEGTLELTILGLAAWHPETWRRMMAALSRRVAASTTLCLPVVVRLQHRGARLLEAGDIETLLAISASRAEQRLAQALLDCPTLLIGLPVPVVARWLRDLVRLFGSELWWEILS